MASGFFSKEKSENVLKQVEFYFSDSNIPRDNFLRKSLKESEDGMINLSLVCSFSRMRFLLGLGAVKPEEMRDETILAVAETLKNSSFLKVSEDGKRVGRSAELSKLEDVIEQADTRTIAVSPLEYNVRRESVEAFFCQHGKVDSVRLPRNVADKNCFCGTALVEFSSEDDAKNILKQSLVYAGVELELRPKKDFDDEREKMRVEIEKYRALIAGESRKASQENESYPKGLVVAFNLKRMPKEASKEPSVLLDEIENATSIKEEAVANSAKNIIEESENISEVGVHQDFMDIQDSDKIPSGPIKQEEDMKMEDGMQDDSEKASDDANDNTEKIADNGVQGDSEKASDNTQKNTENVAVVIQGQENVEMVTDSVAQEGTIQGREEKNLNDSIQKTEGAVEERREEMACETTQNNQDTVLGTAEKVDDCSHKNEDSLQGSGEMVDGDGSHKNEDSRGEMVVNDVSKNNEDAMQRVEEMVIDNGSQKNEDLVQRNGELVYDNVSHKNEDDVHGYGEKCNDDVALNIEDAVHGEKLIDGTSKKNEIAQGCVGNVSDDADGEKVTDTVTLKNEDAAQGSVEKLIDETSEKNQETAQGSLGNISDDTVKKNEVAASAQGISWEDLKHVFQRFGTVKFVDFKMGEESGFVRFEQQESAQKALAAAESGLTVKDWILQLQLVTGDAERDFWTQLRGNLERHHRDQRGGYRGRGGANRGRFYDNKRPRPANRGFYQGRPHKVPRF